MSSALALAASIASMSREELHELVISRHIVSPETVGDPLGLALELLRPDSINRALQALHHEQIAALTSPLHDIRADIANRLRIAGLLGLHEGQPVALPDVTDSLERALAAAGVTAFDAVESTNTRANPAAKATEDAGVEAEAVAARAAEAAEAAQKVNTSAWYAPALTSARRAAALLTAVNEQPAVCGKRGFATAATIRDLAAVVRSEPESVAALLRVLQAARLVTIITVTARYGGEQRLLVPSHEAHTWIAQPLTERWVALATAAAATIGAALRGALARSNNSVRRAVDEGLTHEFPLLPASIREDAETFARIAEELGLTVEGQLSPPAIELLGVEPDETLAAAPQLEVTGASATTTCAEATSQREAAALRLAERDFPPPVAGIYLQPDLSVIVPGPLAPADERALSTIAEAEHWGVAVTLRITAQSLKRAVQRGVGVQAIRSLCERLSLTGVPQPLDYLLSDLERTAGEPGELVAVQPNLHKDATSAVKATNAAAPAATEPSPLDTMIERVLAAASAEPGEAEMSRLLELAIRDRSLVRVIAEVREREYTFTLLPVALTNGRLRGADEVAGVQRTIPLSAIVAVEAVTA